MSSKKRKLRDIASKDEIANPIKKRKLTDDKPNRKSKCHQCRKDTVKNCCKDCTFEYCSKCGLLKTPEVISINMKCPCSKCISRENKGLIKCFGCREMLIKQKANGCLYCGEMFCEDVDHGASCPDCMEWQCSKCMEMKVCKECGEQLCCINGCFMDHEMNGCC